MSMKKVILVTVATGLLAALLLTTTSVRDGALFLAFDSYSSYTTWLNSRRVASALDGARHVELVEFIGEVEITRRVATPDEIRRLRGAISMWPHPFDAKGLAYLCFDPHHSIEIIRSNGSRLECKICFLCKEFSLDEGPTFALLPSYLEGPLSSFFDSVGMSPKTSEEYDDILVRLQKVAPTEEKSAAE